MTEGVVASQLIRMAIPMVGGLLATMGAQVIVTGYVGRLGVSVLAAASFTFPVLMTVMSLGIGLAAGTSAVVARALGGGEAAVARLTTDAVLLAGATTGAFALVGLFTIGPLFRLMGAAHELLPIIASYMRIWYAGVALFVMSMVGLSAVRAAGDTAFQGTVMIGAALLTVVLAPVFIFGAFGVQRLGLAGAALASIAAWLPLLGATLWRMRRFGMLLLEWPSLAGFSASSRRILHIGLPAAATNTIIPVATGIVTAILAPFGAATVAGFGVATRLESVAMVAFFALSAIMNPFVGQNAGARSPERIRKAMRSCVGFCLIWGVALAATLYAAAPWLSAQFTNNMDVARSATAYLSIVPVSYGAAGIIMIVNAAFNGLNRPAAAVVVSVARVIIINVPAAWLGGRLFGAPGVFSGICLANLIVGTASVMWLSRAIAAVDESSIAHRNA